MYYVKIVKILQNIQLSLNQKSCLGNATSRDEHYVPTNGRVTNLNIRLDQITKTHKLRPAKYCYRVLSASISMWEFFSFSVCWELPQGTEVNHLCRYADIKIIFLFFVANFGVTKTSIQALPKMPVLLRKSLLPAIILAYRHTSPVTPVAVNNSLDGDGRNRSLSDGIY